MVLVSVMLDALKRSDVDFFRPRAGSAPHDRRNIGAATSMLMGLHGITESQALDVMALAGRLRDLRLADIAREVLVTGRLDPF